MSETTNRSWRARSPDTPVNATDALLPALSEQLEALLVARNPRGMARVRSALKPGYCLRAAQQLLEATDNVVICTGFPVANTFETDGPAGALALYEFCERSGLRPWLLAGEPLVEALGPGVRSRALVTFDREVAAIEAEQLLNELEPSLFIVIERPGHAEDGRYYNIRGIDISADCRPAEPYVEQAACPVIGIGDGGNEIGMGSAGPVLDSLDIRPAVTPCDELVVADVSNWGAYGIVAMAEYLRGDPILEWLEPGPLLERLVEVGAVDGVTHATTPTEDGLPQSAGLDLIDNIRTLLSRGSQ